MDIVYRIIEGTYGPENGVFAERGRAEYVAHIYKALQDSKTWGELRRNLPDGEWVDHFQVYFDDHEEEIPADDELFDAEEAPGYAEGHYPAWVAQEQLYWFPKELIDKYGGDVDTSVLNGDFLELPADKAEQIADELRAMGHTVEPADLEFA
jgi:hypothetical protein